ncbi:transposase, IS110 family protein [Klebsiella pneumoniae]|uniref:IS110 family transposase n=1 Tax=Enterobacter hormaechei subsp. xiangfangensis TaxID=1296536 RepID=A0A6C0L2S9_9ENTR|nr:hypothetical protein AM393_28440 [Klebsiella pneumoniae]ARX53921.1 hypothetical protein AM375_00970 [Escherichia coli]QHU24665.1 hypothetical protein pLAU_ENM30_NDM1_00015 [Enterobacter hormaechei subsp. xiangfangensis]OVX09148.1 hypothetical protein BME40_25685 [Klebsiella pneumoniae]QHW08680.1 hypothetical protein [Enterobacter hormaechei subsp. xiangfangensis]
MTATNQFAAHVGLDWADKKHDVCVQFKNGERVFHVIEHTAEALDVWLTELHQKGVVSENGIYGHSRFCNTDFDDKLACLNLSGV